MTNSDFHRSAATTDPYAMTVQNLRRRSEAVYLACEESVAKDISAALKWAADEIDRLNGPAQSSQVTDAMVERAWAAIVGSDVAPSCFQASIIRADLKTGLQAARAAQPPAAPVEPCPYAIDGCVLEKQEVGPCLCANPVKCSSAEQHEEATLQICFDKVAKERDQFRAQIKELSRSTERYMRAVAALGKDSGYNKLTYFEAPILNMPTEEMKTEAHNRWLELNDAGIALTLALQPEGGK